MFKKKSSLYGLIFIGLCGWGLYQFDFRVPPPCAFCTDEVLDAQEFARENGVIAMLTYKPVTCGHVLIIPSRHVETFEELTDLEVAAMGRMVKKVDRLIRNRYGNTGYVLLNKNGPSSGSTVDHVHIHYLPRYPKENHLLFALKFWFIPLLKPVTEVELSKELAYLTSAAR